MSNQEEQEKEQEQEAQHQTELSEPLDEDTIEQRFLSIDWKNTSLKAVGEGKTLYIYAFKCIKGKYGNQLYMLDADDNIYKANKSNTETYLNIVRSKNAKHLKDDTIIHRKKYNFMMSSSNKALATLTTEEIDTFNGYEYMKFNIDWCYNPSLKECDKK